MCLRRNVPGFVGPVTPLAAGELVLRRNSGYGRTMAPGGVCRVPVGWVPDVRMLLPAILLLTVGATAPPLTDGVTERIIATARAIDPASLAFDRSTTSVKKGGGMVTRTAVVERWDGRQWALVSYNGRVPTPEQRRETEKQTRAVPVPGYHQMATLIAAATERHVDAQGRMVLTIPQLPANAVRTDSKDISRYLSAEAVIGHADGQPYVERLTVRSRENFKLNFLIKVTSFSQVSDYAPAADGRPRLTQQAVVSQGDLLGIPGGMKSDTVFAYR